MVKVQVPSATSPQVITDMNVQFTKPWSLSSSFLGASSCTVVPKNIHVNLENIAVGLTNVSHLMEMLDAPAELLSPYSLCLFSLPRVRDIVVRSLFLHIHLWVSRFWLGCQTLSQRTFSLKRITYQVDNE